MTLSYSKKENKLSSFLVMLWLGLWLKMRFITIPTVSWSGILETKEKVSLRE